jgi:hypothetical protein
LLVTVRRMPTSVYLLFISSLIRFPIVFLAFASPIVASTFVAKVFTASAVHVVTPSGFLDPKFAARTLFKLVAEGKLQELLIG